MPGGVGQVFASNELLQIQLRVGNPLLVVGDRLADGQAVGPQDLRTAAAQAIKARWKSFSAMVSRISWV